MKSSIGSPSKKDIRRFHAIYEIGCIPCWIEGIKNEPCQIQHVLSGGRRVSHSHSYGSCPWHHEGQPKNDLTIEQAYGIFGPSRKHHKREFTEKYGTEGELIEFQNQAIKAYEESFV